MDQHWEISDISFGQENFPVSCQNEINEESMPEDFEYSSCCVLGPGANEDDFLMIYEGCSCTDNCFSDCLCINRFGPNYEFCHLVDKESAERLIIECSDACKCSKACPNRLVQYGIQFHLQVFRTEKKGFGVRTLDFIPRHSFVCEYAGEIINSAEAKRRASLQKTGDSNYIFLLIEHTGETVIKTIVDPQYTGNVGRFLNHSCDPNLQVIPARVSSSIPRLCFFALRDILPLEELTYDYSGNSEDKNLSASLKDLHCERKPCYCRSVKCAGKLPYDHTLFL